MLQQAYKKRKYNPEKKSYIRDIFVKLTYNKTIISNSIVKNIIYKLFQSKQPYSTLCKLKDSILRRVASIRLSETPKGQHWKADCLQLTGKCVEAVKILEQLIAKNYTPSMATLAHILIDGREYVPQDHPRMLRLLDQGLSKGCPECYGVKASFHMFRDWDPRYKMSRKQSFQLASKSALGGSKYGFYALGKLHLHSYGKNGIESNVDKAIKYLYAAAELGNCEAQYALGMMYRWDNNCLPQDISQTVIWYERAANQGFPLALMLIAQMYEDGIGVTPNIDMAIYWFTRAVAANSRDAELFLERVISKKIIK